MASVVRHPVRAAALLVVLLLLVTGAAAFAASSRSVPRVAVAPAPLPSVVPGAPLASTLPWPEHGTAALAVTGIDFIGDSKGDELHPLASITKVMTALVILEGHPLTADQPGPSVTLTRDDVAEYLREAGNDESVVPMQEGQQLTERQLLDGLLVASANNYAYVLARWDAGSLDAFVRKMNERGAALGLTKTHYADASGISPASMGTAREQVTLAQRAMTMPVFAQVVGQQRTTLPVGGTRETTNEILGQDGVTGIKTGHTDEAGGCFLISAERDIAGRRVQIIGAVLAEPSLGDAFRASLALVDAAASGIRPVAVLPADAVVAQLVAPWGNTSAVTPVEPASLLGWPGLAMTARTDVAPVQAPLGAGASVGTVTLTAGAQTVTAPLRSSTAISGPGLRWRIFRN